MAKMPAKKIIRPNSNSLVFRPPSLVTGAVIFIDSGDSLGGGIYLMPSTLVTGDKVGVDTLETG